jgi:hypothetical protein
MKRSSSKVDYPIKVRNTTVPFCVSHISEHHGVCAYADLLCDLVRVLVIVRCGQVDSK